MSWKTYRVMTWILTLVVGVLFLWNLALTNALPDPHTQQKQDWWCESPEAMLRFQQEYPTLGAYCR